MFSTHEGSYECPHCKAKYDVTFTRYPSKDNDWYICDSCGKKIEWNDTHSPGNFRLRSDNKGRRATPPISSENGPGVGGSAGAS
ncbi:hypothetical protein [Gemmata sp.]|uniref:hypothetical protein n=1 Tax=Gemmata sp. TaxID=1914242 RepID=UPI003F6E45B2